MDLKLLLESETQNQDGYHKIFKYIFIDKDKIWHGHLYADRTTLWSRHSGCLRKMLKPSFGGFHLLAISCGTHTKLWPLCSATEHDEPRPAGEPPQPQSKKGIHTPKLHFWSQADFSRQSWKSFSSCHPARWSSPSFNLSHNVSSVFSMIGDQPKLPGYLDSNLSLIIV